MINSNREDTDMTLYEELFKRKDEMTPKDLTEGVLEQLYWEENLLASQIGNLFGMTKKQVYGRVSKYGLQLRNKIFVDIMREIGKK